MTGHGRSLLEPGQLVDLSRYAVVQNIGFDPDSTHFVGANWIRGRLWSLPHAVPTPASTVLLRDRAADDYIIDTYWDPKTPPLSRYRKFRQAVGGLLPPRIRRTGSKWLSGVEAAARSLPTGEPSAAARAPVPRGDDGHAGRSRMRVIVLKAMILAAGYGTRLRPLTDRLPKCLVSVAGKPVLEHTIEWLVSFGVADIIINVSHLADVVMDRVGDGRRWGVRYFLLDRRSSRWEQRVA